MKLSVRELLPSDADRIINYFHDADRDYLLGMGVLPEKLPQQDEWRRILLADCDRPLALKNFYYTIWELDNRPIGHSNINKIIFGKEAYMHLHLWKPEKRRSGYGTLLLKESIRLYFENFELERLFCEPYVSNPAPNHTLPKVGFELVKSYEPTPGWINFPQTVNQWVLSRARWAHQG